MKIIFGCLYLLVLCQSSSSLLADQLQSYLGSEGCYDLTELPLSQFNETINQNSENWFILFYAKECGYCLRLIPEWTKTSDELSKTKIRIGLVECSKNNKNCLLVNVQGYPTMFYFSGGMMYEYTEERSADEFLYFALDGWKQAKGENIPIQIMGFFEGMVKNVGWAIIILFVFCTLLGFVGLIAVCKNLLEDDFKTKEKQNETEMKKNS